MHLTTLAPPRRNWSEMIPPPLIGRATTPHSKLAMRGRVHIPSVGLRRAAAMLQVVLIVACTSSAAPEPTDVEAVSAPYGLESVDGADLPVDSITILDTSGQLIGGSIQLGDDGRWQLELSFRVNGTTAVAGDSGTFTVTRTNAAHPCSSYECNLDFVSSTRSFVRNSKRWRANDRACEPQDEVLRHPSLTCCVLKTVVASIDS